MLCIIICICQFAVRRYGLKILKFWPHLTALTDVDVDMDFDNIFYYLKSGRYPSFDVALNVALTPEDEPLYRRRYSRIPWSSFGHLVLHAKPRY